MGSAGSGVVKGVVRGSSVVVVTSTACVVVSATGVEAVPSEGGSVVHETTGAGEGVVVADEVLVFGG